MKTEISKATKGSLVELRVAIHLGALGFQVLRNLSPNGSVDLVAISPRGNRVLRIQCKSSLSLNHLKTLRQGNCELLACMVGTEIFYKAISRRVQKLVPGSLLARRPKKRRT